MLHSSTTIGSETLERGLGLCILVNGNVFRDETLILFPYQADINNIHLDFETHFDSGLLANPDYGPSFPRPAARFFLHPSKSLRNTYMMIVNETHM